MKATDKRQQSASAAPPPPLADTLGGPAFVLAGTVIGWVLIGLWLTDSPTALLSFLLGAK